MAPSSRPGRVQTVKWTVAQFAELTQNMEPAVGIKSPLFSSMRTILVPKMSAAGNMGVFILNEGTDPICVNLSVALRNGREVFMKRTRQPSWLIPNSQLGWNEVISLLEVNRLYVDGEGSLLIEISFQQLD